MPIFDPVPFDPLIFGPPPPPIVCIFDPAIFDPLIFQTLCGTPPPPAPAQEFAVGGGGGKSVCLEDLEVFRKLKRLMDGGKSLKQAMAVLDEPEAVEVREELPKKITPKMKNRTMDPTVLAWIDTRIKALQAQVAAIEANQANEREDEDAICFMLPHLL